MKHNFSEISEAARLWPRPELAPDVPPIETLRQYLSDPKTVDEDLRDQIMESINCQRLLMRLRSEAGAGEMEITPEMSAAIAKICTRRKMVRPRQLPVRPPSFPGHHLQGEVWTTQRDVRVFNTERKCLVNRYCFLPPTVMLISVGPETAPPDELVRAVPVTPTELWPIHMLADDEIRLDVPGLGAVVVHLWLDYPVSLEQLDRCLAKVDSAGLKMLKIGIAARMEGLPLTPEFGGGLPLDEEMDADTLLERDRLHASAAWLCATADAKREQAEAKNQERKKKIEQSAAAVVFLNWAPIETAYALAASKGKIPAGKRSLFTCTVARKKLFISVELHSDHKNCGVFVYDDDKNLSSALDGGTLVAAAACIGTIKKGQAKVSYGNLAGGFSVCTKTGTSVKLTPVKTPE